MAQNNSRRTTASKSSSRRNVTYRRSSTAGKYEKRSNPKKQNRSATVIIAMCVLLIGAILVGGYFIYRDQTGVFPDGTVLAGVQIGGMTQSEAITAVENATKNTYSKTPMVVNVLDSQITIEPSISKVSLDVPRAVRAFFKEQDSCKQITAVPYLSVDEAGIKEALNSLGEKYSSTLSQSTYEVTGAAPNQELIVNLGIPEYGLDMNKLYLLVLESYGANVFTTEGQCEMILPNPIALQEILDKYYIAPKDAYFDKSTGKIVDGVNGYGFDVKKAEETLSNAQYGSSVKIPFVDIPPKVTSETLTGSLYKDVLSTFTATETNSHEGRNKNLKVACESLNGTIINPGDTFSFNKIIGELTTAKGYRPGPSVSNGKETNAVGGGIEQVVSNLYYCAMLADMDILSRKNCEFAVSYVPLGMDAVASYGTLDLCFKNTTSYPIRIEACADGGSTTITLFGTDERDYYVELRYEVLATYSYDTIFQEYQPNNTAGYSNGDVIQNGHTGYSVKTYRAKYNTETKELIEEKEEAASYYSKADKIICAISGDSGSSQGIGNGGVTEADGLLP